MDQRIVFTEHAKASGKLQLIRIVVDSGKEGDTVVTVYRTSKIGKYWRAQ
jgi:hypothetical protein